MHTVIALDYQYRLPKNQDHEHHEQALSETSLFPAEAPSGVA